MEKLLFFFHGSHTHKKNVTPGRGHGIHSPSEGPFIQKPETWGGAYLPSTFSNFSFTSAIMPSTFTVIKKISITLKLLILISFFLCR